MSFQFLPFSSQEVTVTTSGTPVSPTTAVFDNTTTLIVQNADSSAVGFFAWADSAPSSIDETNGVIVPAGGAVTIEIGRRSERPASHGGGLFFDSDTSGHSMTVTYVNGMTG